MPRFSHLLLFICIWLFPSLLSHRTSSYLVAATPRNIEVSEVTTCTKATISWSDFDDEWPWSLEFRGVQSPDTESTNIPSFTWTPPRRYLAGTEVVLQIFNFDNEEGEATFTIAPCATAAETAPPPTTTSAPPPPPPPPPSSPPPEPPVTSHTDASASSVHVSIDSTSQSQNTPPASVSASGFLSTSVQGSAFAQTSITASSSSKGSTQSHLSPTSEGDAVSSTSSSTSSQSSPSPSLASTPPSHPSATLLIVGGALALFGVLLLFIVIYVIRRRRRAKRDPWDHREPSLLAVEDEDNEKASRRGSSLPEEFNKDQLVLDGPSWHLNTPSPGFIQPAGTPQLAPLLSGTETQVPPSPSPLPIPLPSADHQHSTSLSPLSTAHHGTQKGLNAWSPPLSSDDTYMTPALDSKRQHPSRVPPPSIPTTASQRHVDSPRDQAPDDTRAVSREDALICQYAGGGGDVHREASARDAIVQYEEDGGIRIAGGPASGALGFEGPPADAHPQQTHRLIFPPPYSSIVGR
ncbi:uncharacterized protein BXZ73DRAFT_76995 [Epithele typhae]|uniref:uncharacterized protein n=1 Tax=Epithele typhae TaxID=378194 RepID=UPI002007B59A|nr:uncharacterized protein BXZ73DRAFT_76995 [Epithele typhae]KAH9934512.1 hypothetical protein BXZ73DRAFT_76995 [Epithele typhae]